MKYETETHTMLTHLSRVHRMDQSILFLRSVCGRFSFYLNFNRTVCEQTMDTLIRHRFMLRLI